MRDSTRNLVTGVTGIVALLGFAYLLMTFGEISGLGGDGWPLKIVLNDAGGIREGSVVTLNGVPVGSVRSVKVTTDPVHPVMVVAAIDRDQRLPRPLTPVILASLIGGGATLGLQTQPGVTGMTEFYPQDGSFTIEGEHVELAERLAQSLGREAQRLADSIGTFRQGFETLAETYAALGRDLDDLVKPIDPEAADSSTANLRVTVVKLNRTLDEARLAMTDARTWLGDGEFRGDVKGAVKDIRSAVDEVTAMAAEGRSAITQYGELAASVRGHADELAGRLVAASDELSATLQQVRAMVLLATRGEGTVASLLTKPDLHRSLVDSAQRLEKALDETQLLLRKIREEGLRLDVK